MFENIDSEKLCMGCMSILPNEETVCPICGFDNESEQSLPQQLPLRTELKEKYIIGRVLGQGGFGITYIGWDKLLGIKVAIKEYYPDNCVSRDSTTGNVVPFTGQAEEAFSSGREKFLQEARVLAKFSGEASIVGVKDFFLEKGTAYIVMEYVDGETLKQVARARDGKFSSSDALNIMKPLFYSLSRVHEAGLLHRDISPDNIILQRDGTIKLLDFGSARQMSISGEVSNTINVKHGYAPEEQYRTRGEQGPWTDVYALCATLYKLTTGVTPTQSLERIMDDAILTPPNELGADFLPVQETAILRGLSVHREDRQQSVDELFWELYDQTVSAYGPQLQQQIQQSKPDDMARRQAILKKKQSTQTKWAIPDQVLEEYTPISCLKNTEERTLYLLQLDTDGSQWVLECAKGVSAAQLRTVYEVCGKDLSFLPKVSTYFEERGASYLIREYISGYTLQDQVKNEGVFSRKEALNITLQVCDMLKALHLLERPVIHGNIDASSVLVTPDGKYRLIGLHAMRYEDAAESILPPRESEKESAAPERINFGKMDVRTDVFGAGMLLIFLITGSYQHQAAMLKNWGAFGRKLKPAVANAQEDRYPSMMRFEGKLRSAQYAGLKNFAVACVACAAIAIAVLKLAGQDMPGLEAGADTPAAPTPVVTMKPKPTNPFLENDQEVHFESALLAEAARYMLEKEADAPLMASELYDLTDLFICGKEFFRDPTDHWTHCDMHWVNNGGRVASRGDISDLSEIVAHMPNLRMLTLDRQNIQDISALASLPLIYLNISDNPITDIAPLAECDTLQELAVGYIKTSNFSALAKLESLARVDLSGNKVDSLTPLAHNKQILIELNLMQAQIEDFSALSDIEIWSLRLYEAPSEILDIVENMHSLSRLAVDASRIRSFERFQGLTKLHALRLAENRISSLEGVEVFTLLEELEIDNNSITDLSPLLQLPKLRILSIREANIKDYSILAELHALEIVRCTENQRTRIERDVPDIQFAIESD